MLEQKSVREKICLDFYPNCTICSCFSECFPKNGSNDELSELALLEQMEKINIDKINGKI